MLSDSGEESMPSRRVLSSFLFAALAFCIMSRSAAGQTPTLEIGHAAPDFSLPGVDGKQYCLKDFADSKLLAIVFTCNHCPAAQAYEDRIQQLASEYREKGVALVAISPNDPLAVRLDELGYTDVGDSFEDMKVRARMRKFAFPYLYDGENQKASRAYGPVSTPHVFLFDSSRRLRYSGRVDDSAKPEQVTTHDTRQAIDALLAGKPVPVENTRTFGCSIKWSDKRDSVRESLERWNQEAVSLDVVNQDGVRSLVANESNKLRVINVWATWCGPCREELPEFVTMHRMYRKRDFELITVSADLPEKKEQALAVLKEVHASCRNFVFQGKNEYELAEALDSQWQGALPYTIVVAPGGKIIYRKQDRIVPLEVRHTIADYLGRVYK